MVGGSAAGGMKETQEMIDFAAKHNITADVEVIPIDYVNAAVERLAKGDVKYRFVIDVANTLNPPPPNFEPVGTRSYYTVEIDRPPYNITKDNKCLDGNFCKPDIRQY